MKLHTPGGRYGIFPVLIVISLAAHAGAGILFWYRFPALQTPAGWRDQFFPLLGFSLAVSIALSASSPARSARNSSFLLIQFCLLIIMGYPMGRNLEVKSLLAGILLVEAALYLPWPFNAGVCSLVIGFLLAGISGPIRVWDVMIAPAELAEIVSLGVFLAVLSIVGCLLRAFMDRLAAEIGSNKRLSETVDRLTNANLEFQRFAIDAEEASMIRERKRISREIHDTTGYAMTNIIMMSEAARALIDSDAVKAAGVVEQMKQQAQSGLNETRRALRELRSIDDSRATGLKAVNHLVRTFEKATGVTVIFNYANAPWSLGERIDDVVYRLVQEGMTNAFRHGRATRIIVNFWHDESGLFCHIHDNGQGSTEIVEGMGISGMRERIEGLQGRLDAYNLADGFQLSAWIPLKVGGSGDGKNQSAAG
jgi:signal transduction histidine kinase